MHMFQQDCGHPWTAGRLTGSADSHTRFPQLPEGLLIKMCLETFLRTHFPNKSNFSIIKTPLISCHSFCFLFCDFFLITTTSTKYSGDYGREAYTVHDLTLHRRSWCRWLRQPGAMVELRSAAFIQISIFSDWVCGWQ